MKKKFAPLEIRKSLFFIFSSCSKPSFEEYPCPSLELITKFNLDIIRKLKPLESENKDILNNFKSLARYLEDSSRLCSQNYKRANLGEFLGLARRFYKKEIEPPYLEIPFSQICNSDEFLSFFLEIIKNIEKFLKRSRK